MKKKGKKFICFLAGKGPLEKELYRLTADFNLQKHIHFLGFIDHLPELLSLGDIFILPSINEGLGSVLLEAIHYDCSLIGADSGGIPEIVKNNHTGLLVDPLNPEDIANKIEKLMGDPTLQQSLRKAAQTHLNSNFRKDYIVKNIVEILQ